MTTEVQVFPVVDLLSDAKITKAARDALFGPRMRVFPGGWSFFDAALRDRAAITPPVVATAQMAETVGRRFMADANDRWAKAGQTSLLLPTDPTHFRLIRTATRQLSRGKRPLGWALTWLVFANLGSGAAKLTGMTDPFVPVTQAVVKLTVTMTGRIVAGSASWRPTLPPLRVPQVQTPEGLRAHIAAARAKAPPGVGHEATDHGHAPGAKGAPPSQPLFGVVFAAAERSEFCTFLDPRITMGDPANQHGPGLVVPMTEYGLSASIVTAGSRDIAGQGRITAMPWVIGCTGTVPVNPLPTGYAAHWTVQDMTAGAAAPHGAVAGAAPLVLSGLAQVAFTVTNPKGAIAHAHAEICSTPDAPVRQQAGFV